jgi:MFS family permease
MPFATSGLWLALSLVAFGALGKPAVEPVMLAWLGDRVSRIKPEAMSSTMGVVNFVGQASGILAPILTGWIRDESGSLEGGFFLGAAVVFCGFLLCLFAKE